MAKYENYQVTVIIPTLCESKRRDSLLRAIECVLNQNGVRALPLVIIKGKSFDPDLREELESRDDVVTLFLTEERIDKARAYGVLHVKTPYYAFLDEEDIFTDNALSYRLALMESSPPPDVAVTNIYIEKYGDQYFLADNMRKFSIEPAYSIFEVEWLNSSNNMFRTETITFDYFQGDHQYISWTALGFRLAKNKRIMFSNVPTAIYRETKSSKLKKYSYLKAGVEFLASLPQGEFPTKTRRLINRRLSAALNELSLHAYTERKMADAWRFHLECLMIPGGWRYLSYTKKLIWPHRGGASLRARWS